MSAPTNVPLDVEAAHEVVREHLDTDSTPESSVDPRLAAGVCLRNETTTVQGDGARLLAAIADDDAQDVVPPLYDLAAGLDANNRQTRAHAMAAFQVSASIAPVTAIDMLDAVVPRLSDPDPLVREAAASTVGWLAEEVRKDTRDIFPADTEALFHSAMDPLFTILTTESGHEHFDWETEFSIAHPARTFRGEIDAGESRREEGRRQAAFAVAVLADWYPEQVVAHASTLAELAVSGAHAETRWYVTDALARAGADDALHIVRDRARTMLNDPSRRVLGVETLYHLTTERPAILGPAVPDLVSVLDELNPDQATLTGNTILNAAANDPDLTTDCVDAIIREWLQAADGETQWSSRVSSDLVVKVAVAHPERVLPWLSQALDGPLSCQGAATCSMDTSAFDNRSQEWDVDQAWDALLALAEQDRRLVWEAVSGDWLRARLTGRSDGCARVRKLYAHAVPVPPPAEDLSALIEAVRDDAAGARSAVYTLQSRAPEAVAAAATEVLNGTSPPSADLLGILSSLSGDIPVALAALQPTLRAWNDGIQPGDKSWKDLITIRGRIAIATDDTAECSQLLHLEQAEYCQEFLQTAVASPLIQMMPNTALPALLEHLQHGNRLLQKRILSVFETDPDDYGGWEPTIRDAVIARATDGDYRIRKAAVQTLSAWLESLPHLSARCHDRWVEPLRATLIDRLNDDDWRVRAYTARALAAELDDDTREILESRLSQEMEYPVRFEIQRVLHQHT